MTSSEQKNRALALIEQSVFYDHEMLKNTTGYQMLYGALINMLIETIQAESYNNGRADTPLQINPSVYRDTLATISHIMGEFNSKSMKWMRPIGQSRKYKDIKRRIDAFESDMAGRRNKAPLRRSRRRVN